jgi:exopolysaccharide biosynthesis protein
LKILFCDPEAVLAINGDHLIDNKDFAVRNSVMFDLPKSPADKLVLYDDGSMETFTADQLDKDKIKEEGGVYQLWTFGPMLLKDGQPMTKFNTTLSSGGDPRTAVGYYEPGHYCFLVADGRQPGYSDGLSFKQMSQLFYQLGCKVAFNLDGGQSCVMVFNGKYIDNKTINNERPQSDIIYIASAVSPDAK